MYTRCLEAETVNRDGSQVVEFHGRDIHLILLYVEPISPTYSCHHQCYLSYFLCVWTFVWYPNIHLIFLFLIGSYLDLIGWFGSASFGFWPKFEALGLGRRQLSPMMSWMLEISSWNRCTNMRQTSYGYGDGKWSCYNVMAGKWYKYVRLNGFQRWLARVVAVLLLSAFFKLSI